MKPNQGRWLSQQNSQAFRNPWVIGWLLLVLVVLVVNAGMITMAFLTNPGLVEQDYYEKGRERERHFQQQLAARNALGWQLTLTPPERIVQGESGLFRLQLLQADDTPLRGAEISVTAYRPADASADFTFPLKEIVPGQYDGFAALPLKGLWDLNIVIRHGSDSYDLSRRIAVISR